MHISIFCTWQKGILNQISDEFFKLWFLFSLKSKRITNFSPVLECNLLIGSCSTVFIFWLPFIRGIIQTAKKKKKKTGLTGKKLWRNLSGFPSDHVHKLAWPKNPSVFFEWTKLPSITYRENFIQLLHKSDDD